MISFLAMGERASSIEKRAFTHTNLGVRGRRELTLKLDHLMLTQLRPRLRTGGGVWIRNPGAVLLAVLFPQKARKDARPADRGKQVAAGGHRRGLGATPPQ
jgi:hypothetical protein